LHRIVAVQDYGTTHQGVIAIPP